LDRSFGFVVALEDLKWSGVAKSLSGTDGIVRIDVGKRKGGAAFSPYN